MTVRKRRVRMRSARIRRGITLRRGGIKVEFRGGKEGQGGKESEGGGE
jgi:hypothetical protein